LQGLISYKEILLPFLPVCVRRTGRHELYN